MIACVSPVSDGELTVLGMDPRADGPADPRPARRRAAAGHAGHGADRRARTWRSTVATSTSRGASSGSAWPSSSTSSSSPSGPATRSSRSPGGMKRRLTIARSLINEPDLLLLDEPTTGLDPQARHLLWDRLYRLKQKGVTLVLTTHYMDEAEQLCDRLVVMDKARIVAEGSPRQLIERAQQPRGPGDALPGRASRRRSTGRSRGSATGWSGCPTACSSTRTTATRPRASPTSAACGRR